MSSDDERFGAEIVGVLPSLDGLLFQKQVDWIRALTGYVQDRQDLFLLIRVHPREFPNKRERVLSEHAKTLMSVMTDLPPNARVNWPTDGISLFDLANVADVFANGWSSAGKEVAWLGLPVVLYSPDLVLYSSELNYVGNTQAEYFAQMQRALADGWSPERIRMTYRYCALEYEYSPLDISESFARSEHGSRLQKGLRKILGTIAPSLEQRNDLKARAPRLAAAARISRVFEQQLSSAVDLQNLGPQVSFEEETRALKVEVGRVVRGLYGTAGGFPPNTLAYRLRQFADST
jgi:hypothetical protein